MPLSPNQTDYPGKREGQLCYREQRSLWIERCAAPRPSSWAGGAWYSSPPHPRPRPSRGSSARRCGNPAFRGAAGARLRWAPRWNRSLVRQLARLDTLCPILCAKIMPIQRALLCAALAFLGATAQAQWLNYRAAGTPITPDGKVDLSARAPRAPDGKPDLTGVWHLQTMPGHGTHATRQRGKLDREHLP